MAKKLLNVAKKLGFWIHISLCMIFTILQTLWNSEQKNGLLIKLFCFSFDLDENWWSCSYPCALQFHQVSSKLDEKQKSFINSPFFCSEFQSVSRIVKIKHSGWGPQIGYIVCDLWMVQFPICKKWPTSTLSIVYRWKKEAGFCNADVCYYSCIKAWPTFKKWRIMMAIKRSWDYHS